MNLDEDRECAMVANARLYARAAFRAIDHRRKVTNEPYEWHPQRVAETVRRAGHRPELVAAAHLHDTIEDTKVTHDDIAWDFGPVVAGLVRELSHDPDDKRPRAIRKAAENERLRGISADAQTIKYADIIDNVSDIAETDAEFAAVYIPEKRTALRLMDRGDPDLRAIAAAEVKKAAAKIGISP